MNKKMLAYIAVSTLVVFGPVWWYGSRTATLNRPQFDSYDKKKLKKAYGVMFRKILTDKYDYDHIDFNDNEQLDIVLAREYRKL